MLTLISWFFEGLMFYYAAKFIELETSFIAAFLFASFVALGSSVPSTPGSIGVFESSVLFVILLLGLDPSKGLSLGIIVHLIQVLCIVLFTIVTFICCSPYHVQKEFGYEFRGSNDNPTIYKYHGSFWAYYRDHEETYFNMPYKKKNWKKLPKDSTIANYTWYKGKWELTSDW